MILRRPSLLRFLLLALGLLGCLGVARAQFEMRGDTFTRLRQSALPNGGSPVTTTPQFAGAFVSTGGSSAKDADATFTIRYPASTGTVRMVLHRSSLGNVFASGVPRYLLGDVITPPTTKIDGTEVLAADLPYWRAQPVKTGESFNSTEVPLPIVIALTAGGSGYTSAPTVTISGSAVSGATAVATLVGDTVGSIVVTSAGSGYITPPDVTLSGGGGSGAKAVVSTPRQPFYYSPHAERVFASQAGRVAVMWVTTRPVAGVGGDTVLKYRTRSEVFAVSSAASRPSRNIYWTERSFNSPIVNIPVGKIETINPIYSIPFPRLVAEEYAAVGYSKPADPNSSLPAELRTVWFEKAVGVGQLHAYNLEGRLLIEYLGALKPGTADVYEFLGCDILDVGRVAPVVDVVVKLGDQITPRDDVGRLLPINQSSEWLASPVTAVSTDGQSLYGSVTRKDGRTVYYAERENATPDRVAFYWLEKSDAAIHFLTAPATPDLGIYWPQLRNHYQQVWPSAVTDYEHNTIAAGGGTAATGLAFAGGTLPQIVFQDDPAQGEAQFDNGSQRVVVSSVSDGLNRSLLKFTAANEVWYVRLYSQTENRSGFQEGDALAALSTSAIVGQRIDAPAGYEVGGYLSSGTGFLPAAYVNPFALGAEAAARGAIIPVNAVPGNNVLKVWWFKKVAPPSSAFQPFYVPAKIGTYTVAYPAAPDPLVLASNAGSGALSSAEAAGSLYFQNDRTLPGFNPNEEHALLLGDTAYALRDDLNNVTASATDYTSQPFVLLRYTSPIDGRPAMRAFKVVREDSVNGKRFDYTVTAGTRIPAPMPLPLLPLPTVADGTVKNLEVSGTADSAHQGPASYTKFTYRDRQGYDWVYRGPHASSSPTLGMQFYYPMQAGFYVPAVSPQPEVGTALPYLRPLSSGVPQGNAVTGTALTIIYRPAWPANAPELRVAETLTLPKFGLPAVLTQTSAAVLYQQSVAVGGTGKSSVILHDPIREKTYTLATSQLEKLPTSVLTTSYQGKTYFQGLPPHLQSRFYFDQSRGAKGTLVFLGRFVDEPAGEDYLQVNVLSATDLASLKGLAGAGADKTRWDTAIDGLATKVETFVKDPARAGSFKSDGAPVTRLATEISAVSDSNTAVVDYALTATGAGSGWVTLVFGDGQAFTPAGEPLSLSVIRVTPRLNVGELKVELSANPLDEKVSLRHSADFAGDPSGYEFEWRYSPPVTGLAPAVYTYAMSPLAASTWQFAANPAGDLPTAAEYSATATPRTLPYVFPFRTDVARALTRPATVARWASGPDFTAGVPARIVFSASLTDTAGGFVLYINGVPALAFQAPAPFANTAAATGLVSDGLTNQFEVQPNFFRAGPNTVEVALFTTYDLDASVSFDARMHRSTETDQVVALSSPWLLPNGTLDHQVVVGGAATSPLGSPLLVMTDNWFTMRYRPRTGSNNVAPKIGATADYQWSRWTQPRLVEGWIKRALAGINPFNQRVSDLFNNAVNTDVSLLTSAGQRWEGNISLNLENIEQFGLIEIYETILNRGKNISIDSGYDYAPANDALLLAAGYLADLYTLLGNEAYADAANPTISVDDSTSATEVNTSRFSFEGQVKSVLEEELALLRGRDDTLSTAINVAPAYNRLYWNYTRGINSGEALYAVNYNIREKSGSTTADGQLDAADAQRMFPQGHGDAYGHYLTALKGYTRLLQHPNFTWIPRPEVVTVLGQSVQVDYFDERKFAAAALGLARTAGQILELTHRESYRDDPSAGWSHYRDARTNTRTGVTRYWGVDEWTARATQGSYFNWLLGNAILPDVDPDSTHTGVQVIDRTTVPELRELPSLAESFQTKIDTASSHLNPLGLSPSAIAFDISPSELKSGQSHYDQIYTRSLRTVTNAKGAFDQAARMTRLLRNQENQTSSYNDAIVDQERAFVRQLIEIYGTPYSGSIGAGKIYAQGYAGPDTQQWFIVDRPTGIVDTTTPVSLTLRLPVGIATFTSFSVEDIKKAFDGPRYEGTLKTFEITVSATPNQLVQYADNWARLSGTSLGTRAVTGKLQQAMLDSQEAYVAVLAGADRLRAKQNQFQRRYQLYRSMVDARLKAAEAQGEADTAIQALKATQNSLRALAFRLELAGTNIGNLASAVAEFLPKVVGLSVDATSPARGALLLTGSIVGNVLTTVAAIKEADADAIDPQIDEKQSTADEKIATLGLDYQQAQVAYEYELMFRDLLGSHFEIEQLLWKLQRSMEQVRNVIAEGVRVLDDRETFRQRAAAIVQGYRTKDVTFRVFRNEALEQYRSLFDLAARYTYLSAKAYDYETGLLGSTTGQSAINAVVAARSLGDLTGGVPQATVSTLGDAGLAGTMARMQADWAVAKPRLGINNPDVNGTLFSLRTELFRLLPDAAGDPAWQQTLEQHIMSDIMADSDVAAACRNLKKADGSAVPGIVIPFSSTIQQGRNFFGLPLAAGDHKFTTSNFATKIYSVGMVMKGYVGLDPYAIGTPNAGSANSTAANALSATPYVYLIPVGTDYMLAPPLGDTGTVRTFDVHDQALPLPFNLGATSFSTTQFFTADGTLSEAPWILRKHQSFRPVNDPAFFYSTVPAEFTSSRLVGRSVWNSGWKIVIPAYELLNNEQDGLNRFAASVKDIQLFLRTYSHSGN